MAAVGSMGSFGITFTPIGQVTNAHLDDELSVHVFGAKQWNIYFGDVGEEPSLPKDINEKLRGPCPIWEGKRVCETHMLVLIPAKVNSEDFSIQLLEELVQSPKSSEHSSEFCYMEGPVIGEPTYLRETIGKSYWILSTKEVVPGTSSPELLEWSKDLKTPRLEVVSRYKGYQVPTLLEITTAIFVHHVRTGERLFDEAERVPHTYCRNDYKRGLVVGFPKSAIFVVGGWGRKSKGLRIGIDPGINNFVMGYKTGAAAVTYLENQM